MAAAPESTQVPGLIQKIKRKGLEMRGNIRYIFINPAEQRARMLWRVLGQLGLSVVFFLPVQFIVASLVVAQLQAQGAPRTSEALMQFLIAHPAYLALNSWLTLIGLSLSIWLASRVLDRRPLKDFGLRPDNRWWPDFGFGLALGGILMLLIFFAELSLGWLTITDTFHTASGAAFAPAVFLTLLHFTAAGTYEELFSRGYEMTNFAQGFRGWFGPRASLIVALVLSSTIFGSLHATNPNATVMSTLNIVVVGICLLGLGYLLTGSLAISIGVHISWNFFQGCVFGFPVSGTPPNTVTFLATTQNGNPLFTGGEFGPEGGLIGLLAVLLGAGLILLWVRTSRGKIEMYLPMTNPPRVEEGSPPETGPESGPAIAHDGDDNKGA